MKENNLGKHGKWVMKGYVPGIVICTVCGCNFDITKKEIKDFRTCPNCGAKMGVKKEVR